MREERRSLYRERIEEEETEVREMYGMKRREAGCNLKIRTTPEKETDKTYLNWHQQIHVYHEV